MIQEATGSYEEEEEEEEEEKEEAKSRRRSEWQLQRKKLLKIL